MNNQTLGKIDGWITENIDDLYKSKTYPKNDNEINHRKKKKAFIEQLFGKAEKMIIKRNSQVRKEKIKVMKFKCRP